jgi:hypothetical protein
MKRKILARAEQNTSHTPERTQLKHKILVRAEQNTSYSPDNQNKTSDT